MFAPKDSNVEGELSAKHIAIGSISDAISVTVLARMMVGSRRRRTLFDGRRSDSDEGRLEILVHPP